MKTKKQILLAGVICLNLVAAHAQPGPGPRGMMGGPPSGPRLNGSMAKLFGNNADFSANLEVQGKGDSPDASVTMPGKIAFAEGKSRFAMDLTQMKGGGLPPGAAAQMKAMGMDKMTMITRPDKKTSYMVYPGMSAYVEMPIQDPDALKPPADFKIETTELGKETVEGLACVKSKAVVTDDKGVKREYTMWNATELKNFPIKIESSDQGPTVVLLFKDVKFSKPEASEFDPPSNFKSYSSMQTMMQEVMMQRMGDGAGGPPGP